MSEIDRKNISGNKKSFIALAVVVLVIALFGAVYFAFGPKTTEGSKSISVEVVIPDKESREYKYQTDDKYLGEVLLDKKLIAGEEGEYGLFITTVDGVTADDTKQQWWCITKQGETVNTAVDLTPIQDGDQFEITLMEGY